MLLLFYFREEEEFMKFNKKKIMGSIMLFITAFIWGVAFVAQSVGMDYIGPFTFNGIRMILAAFAVLPTIWIFREKDIDSKTGKSRISFGIYGGIVCGICLFAASMLQQTGIQYTTVGKAGFITALYIIIVPLIRIFTGKKIGLLLWISVIIAVIGMYLLCITEKISISKGDFLVTLCALTFAVHILAVDYFVKSANGIVLSCTQFFVAGTMAVAVAIIIEKPELGNILKSYIPILYAGILSGGLGYTFQIIGQKHVRATVAAMIMSLESVFAVLSGWLLLNQNLTFREIVGCILVFIAIMLAQLNSDN